MARKLLQEAGVLRELADGVYIYTGHEDVNSGLIVTQRGALLVDTPMLPSEAREWKSILTGLAGDSIYGIVNTDYHPEHFFGNAVFMPIRTWGHDLSAKPIAKYETSGLEQISSLYRECDPDLADEIASIHIYPPELCVEDRATLYLGDRRVEILYLEGHTPASLGVYLPEERILFAGDNVVNDRHPAACHANSLAWLQTLARIRDMEVDVIVPGEGEPCGKEAIGPLVEYITEMRRRSEELYMRGASRRETVEKVDMLDWFPFTEEQAQAIKRRRRESVERIYTEIRIARRKRVRRQSGR